MRLGFESSHKYTRSAESQRQSRWSSLDTLVSQLLTEEFFYGLLDNFDSSCVYTRQMGR